MLAVMVAVIAALFALGVPISFALLAASLVYFVGLGGYPLEVWAQRTISGVDSFPLLAVPFFILAGSVMNAAGITDRLISLAALFTRTWHGGLGQVSVLVSMMFGGVSGSAIADVAAQGQLLVEPMERRGYPRPFSAAIIVSSSVITAMIPPSIGLIIYGFITGTSIGRLFVAGIVPGLLITAALLVLVYALARRHGIDPPRARGMPPLADFVDALRAALWALLLPVMIVAGLRLGVFTPTEAGAAAAAVALAVGLVVYRTLPLRRLPGILSEAASQTAVVMLVIAAASPFGWVVALEHVPAKAADALLSISGSDPFLLLLLVNVLLLVAGTAIDPAPLLLLLVPVLFPAVVAAGVDPVHFGIIVNLNLLMGSISPPEGPLLYTGMSVARVSMAELTRAILPFFAVLLALLAVLTYVPAISLALPSLIYGP